MDKSIQSLESLLRSLRMIEETMDDSAPRSLIQVEILGLDKTINELKQLSHANSKPILTRKSA